MRIKYGDWPEGHPHLTKIEGGPFGFAEPVNPNPLLDDKHDGYRSTFMKLYRDYKARAVRDQLEFTLTEQHFYQFTSQPCYFCAAPPSQVVDKRRQKSYVYNGIDRLDSEKGYVPGNCVASCWRHNDLKGRLSFMEFYRHSLAFVLSVSSRTALDTGDLRCLELLIELFPNVPFLNEHRLALLENIKDRPNDFRFNWRLESVRPKSD
jgi:hypothetical protein